MCVQLPPPCAFDAETFLSQDFAIFDQSAQGWRKISAIAGCEEAAADLISLYRREHGLVVDKMKLDDEQRAYSPASTLNFHEA